MIKKVITKFFNFLGLDIVRYPRVESIPPPPPAKKHPIAALYTKKLPLEGSCSFTCYLNWCVTELGFGYGIDHWHPYVEVLLEYKRNKNLTYSGSVLERYYNTWHPKNATEALLKNKPGPSKFSDIPPFAYVVPWTNKKFSDRADKARKFMKAENTDAGNPEIGSDEGYNHFGPVSTRKGQLEFNRLITVYNSINDTGYKRERGGDGDIRGYLLRRDEQYRFLIYGGYHRLAAVAALGYESIPVRIDNTIVIEHRDADYWPQVQRGIWSKQHAVNYFHMLFDFDSQKWAGQHGLAPLQ